MRPAKHKKVDVLALALPQPNPAWTGITARTNSGSNVLRQRHAPTASEVSRARSELFGRLRPRQLFRMLGLEQQLGSIAEDGESILGAALAARSEPVLASQAAGAASPPRASAGGGGAAEAPAPEVIVLDIRPAEAAEAFAAVRLVGALHVPFAQYMTQDRLPACMHAARRQVPQPVIVLYDDCTGRALDGADFASKLIQAGRFDAVMLLEGGLRSAAVEEPRLVEGARALDYITGVKAEIRRGQGGHGLRAAAAQGGGAELSPTKSLGASERGSQVSTARSVGSFGSSKRF